MAMFNHEDGSGSRVDYLEVLAVTEGTSLLFLAQSPGDVGDVSTRCRLDREAVQRLHNVLGEWLYPQNLGPNPGDYTAAVKALGDAVNGLAGSIRPLWSAPAADKPGCYGCTPLGCTDPNHGEPIDPEPHEVCTCTHDDSSHGHIGCTALTRLGPVPLVCRCRWRVTDPEPRDVGHPEPEPLCARPRPYDAHVASRCTHCGHLWLEHEYAAPEPTPLERVREFYRSTLSPEAVVPAPKQLVGCECGHRWALHSPSERLGCFATHQTGADLIVCECTRTRPGAPRVECTCGHPLIPAVHTRLGCEVRGCTCRWTGTP